MDERYALISFVPEVCPDCGASGNGRYFVDVRDFLASAPHTCPHCGLHFRYIRSDVLSKLYEEFEDGSIHLT